MDLCTNAHYDLLTLSSMGIRITPVNRQPLHTSTLFELQATSAETNVLSIPAALGLKTKVLTKFIKDCPISNLIKADLRRRNIQYEGIEVEQEGPWGYRHQFNIADGGFGVRGPMVWNDRAGEVGQTLSVNELDIHRLFVSEGCKILHLSGLIASVSEVAGECCRNIIKFAKDNGVKISFDINYRNSFWKGRQHDLHSLFSEIAEQTDILIGNEEDFQLSLGIEGPEITNSLDINSYKEMITRAKRKYPSVRVFVITLRKVNNANSHDWGALLWMDNQWYVKSPCEIPVLDRIGSGDGFVGGLLYGILKSWEPEKWLQFGWSTGALVTTMTTDYASPLNEDQIWDIFKGNARVIR